MKNHEKKDMTDSDFRAHADLETRDSGKGRKGSNGVGLNANKVIKKNPGDSKEKIVRNRKSIDNEVLSRHTNSSKGSKESKNPPQPRKSKEDIANLISKDHVASSHHYGINDVRRSDAPSNRRKSVYGLLATENVARKSGYWDQSLRAQNKYSIVDSQWQDNDSNELYASQQDILHQDTLPMTTFSTYRDLLIHSLGRDLNHDDTMNFEYAGEDGESQNEAIKSFVEDTAAIASTSVPDLAKILQAKMDKLAHPIKFEVNQRTWVDDMRGYHSDPGLPIPPLKMIRKKHKKGKLKPQKKVMKKKCLSMEDISLCSYEYPELITGVLSEVQLRSYAISDRILKSWQGLFEMEKERFSFFDELFARGYVIDSMEVPGKPNDMQYFVEADETAYRAKVDYARVVFKTKHMYTGNFVDWFFEGPGRYLWIDGTIYQGEFKHGVMHGEGTLLWPDGRVYEGQFFNGMRAGWGIYSTAEGYTYAGDWLQGLPNGKGKMWYDPQNDNGDYYDGEWQSGVQTGHGVRQYSNGDRYIGEWEAGKRTKTGTMIWLNERQVYKGMWENNVPNGHGTHIWYLPRTRGSNFPTRHVYEGDFLDGTRHGIGRMIYPCGSIYEGRWRDGQRSGKGLFINPAGDLLVGLFRSGSISGGLDVPLHSPTYDCDFGGLVEWVGKKFLLDTEDEFKEEEELSIISIRYLVEIRKLYTRAGNFGQWWGNNGLYPSWLKRTDPNHKNHTIPHHETANLDDSPHMRGRSTKTSPPDGVCPVTRFGLWLLIKDCPGLLQDVTMAHFDKIWSETPPISFQTRHNPFEPVYLWQFLQCLVVVAIAIYMEIPEIKRRSNFEPEKAATTKKVIPVVVSEVWSTAGNNEGSAVGPQDESTESVKDSELGNSETTVSKRSVLSNNDAVVDSVSDDGESRNRKESSFPLQIMPSKIDHVPHQEDVVRTIKLQKRRKTSHFGEVDGEGDSFESKSSRKRILNAVQHKQHIEKSNDSKMNLELNLNAPSPHTKKDDVESEESDSEIVNQTSFRNDKKKFSVSISEAFERLLVEKLFPCLENTPGINLPDIPDPLPSISDLHEAFTTLTNGSYVMNGVELLQSIVPHLIHPGQDDGIWWHRCPENLSAKIDLDQLFNLMKSLTKTESTIVPKQNSLGDEFLGTNFSNADIFSEQIKTEAAASFAHSHHVSVNIMNRSDEKANTVFGIQYDQPGGDENERVKSLQSNEDANTYRTESLPFAEEDLAPSPFLWKEPLRCIKTKKDIHACRNLTSNDVINVMRHLYPNACGPSHETNLNFEMIFCDWLWCVTLCSKISADRDFLGYMMKGSDMKPNQFQMSRHLRMGFTPEMFERLRRSCS